jgi:hypothetical protein
MAASGPNPVVYIVPAVVLAAVLLYYLYGAADRLALETHHTEARVTGKQFAPGSTTYNTTIVAGRAWTQGTKNPDIYVIGLDVEGKVTGGAVSRQMYESLQAGERVRVEYQRTRFSKQILVTDVRP